MCVCISKSSVTSSQDRSDRVSSSPPKRNRARGGIDRSGKFGQIVLTYMQTHRGKTNHTHSHTHKKKHKQNTNKTLARTHARTAYFTGNGVGIVFCMERFPLAAEVSRWGKRETTHTDTHTHLGELRFATTDSKASQARARARYGLGESETHAGQLTVPFGVYAFIVRLCHTCTMVPKGDVSLQTSRTCSGAQAAGFAAFTFDTCFFYSSGMSSPPILLNQFFSCIFVLFS